MRGSKLIFSLLILFIYITVFSIIILIIGLKFGAPLVFIEAENIHILLNFFGVPNILIGNMIYLPNDKIVFEITWQCSGLFTLSLYTLIYLTFPKMRRKVVDWIFGSSIIYIVNLVRIATSIYLYHLFGEEAFKFFHFTIGPIILFTTLTILLGYLLVKSLKTYKQ